MLHRSFKPAKCKTALKLASSRIKLLRNKRAAQVKHLKRELAQLLEAGQDQTARIRVEHVVREEKTMAAYELIEIYCELIVARLPVIESQKNCPIDLKEAVSSVIFASPRCADVPELIDVRKHLTAKYGKEFVTAAVEIRPDCGVSRLLVEKLSATAPDGPTKIKILTAIAEEHNIKWDPKSFGEKDTKPPEEMLNGPDTFEQASRVHVEPTNVQASQNRVDQGSHNLHDPSQHHVKHDVPANSHGPDLRSSPHSYPDHRPLGNHSGVISGTQNWNMEFKDATAAAQAAAESAERASMAARAAAELSSQGKITRQHSAESQKAFAFASRDAGPQNYTGSKLQGEDVDKDQIRNTVYQGHSGLHREEREGNEEDELAGLTKRFYNLKSPNKPSRPASSKSSNSSVDDQTLIDDLPMSDRHSPKRSSELGESSVKLESRKSEVSFVSKLEDGMTSENVSCFEEARIRKQPSSVSSHSHSQTFSDDYNVFSNANQQRTGEETDKEQRDAKRANSYDNDAMVFDDSASDKEFKFDVEDEHNGQDYDSDFSSEGRKTSSHLFANTDAWGPMENIDEFQGKSSSQILLNSVFVSQDVTADPVPSQAHDLLPVTFDDSDGASSEREMDLDTYEVVGDSSTGIFAHTKSVSTRNSDPMHSGSPHSIRSSLADEENLGSHYKTHSRTSSLDSDDQEVFSKKYQGTGVDVETDNKFAYSNMDTSLASPIPVKFRTSSNDLKDNLQTSGHALVKNVQNYELPITTKNADPIEGSSLETGTGLNLGILTGGRRNRGYTHPPYHRNLSNNSSSSKQAIENIYSSTGRSTSPAKVDIGSGARDQETNNQRLHPKLDLKASSRAPATYYDDDSDEEVPQKHYGQKLVIEGNDRSSTKTSDNRESGFSKQISSSKTHLSSGLSRRTKASPSSKDYSSKASVLSKSSVSADIFVERTSSSSGSSTADTQSIPQSRNSGYQGSSEQCRSTEEAASKQIQQSKRFSNEESSSRSSDAIASQQKPLLLSKSSDYWESSRLSPRSAEQADSKQISDSKRSLRKENLKSSDQEKPFSSPPKKVATDSAQSSKTSKRFSNEESSSRSSDAIASQQKPLSVSKSSDYWESSRAPPRSAEQAASKQISESKRSLRQENLKSSDQEKPFSSPPKKVATDSAQSSKTSKRFTNEESSSRGSDAIAGQQKPLSVSKSSDYWESSRAPPRSAEQAASNQISESKRSLRQENLKSSDREKPFSSPPKKVATGSAQSSKTSSTHGETPSRENSIKKASHVHPKLPDFDTFEAHLLSLRQNRQ
ncbi:hypothetical protein OIU77_030546 [Salix suchowensis]|uniref:Regulator of Vps4 activity in the MVB pathway protein n=1 Tax=Salix suchowensis TaxID=1278906 RepID=A0ABQ9BEZ9_9ROSI|nr:hypothetical protein OIU77_030546 [Salix suchowensis]